MSCFATRLSVVLPLLATVAGIPTRLLSQQASEGSGFPAAGVDSVFAKYNHTERPGCALGVFRDGGTVYSRGYGMADLNQGIPIAPNTVFYIASTSKQFAAASLQLLAMQGKVSLDDPVRKYIPELPAYADSIKLHHLMHHQSGIRDYLGLWGMSGESGANELPEEKALDLIARQKATDFSPGSKFSYSNSGYFLISQIVKRVSGQSLRDFAHANIFEPLGMHDTHFHDDNTEIVPHRAEGYEPDGKGGYRIVRTSFALVGDGGLYTTVNDMAKWDENFFHNKLAGGQAFIDRMYQPATLSNGDHSDYASGLFHLNYRGLDAIDHGGAFIGYRAELLRFPSVHTSVTILCNDYTAQPEAMAKQVANVVLRDKFPPAAAMPNAGASPTAPVTVAASTLDRYVGRYEFVPGVVASVTRDSTRLTLTAAGTQLVLTPTSDTTFANAMLPGAVTFRKLRDGRMGLMAQGVTQDGPAPQVPPAPALTPTITKAWAGRYFSEELGANYVIREAEGKLQIRAGYGAWGPLTAFAPGSFTLTLGKITADQEKGGRVTAFHFDAGRMHNIKFVRVD